MNALWLVVPVVLLSLVEAIRRARRRHLARLRAAWGAPVARTRRLDAISTSHVNRLDVLGGGSLDERTWADLHLDDVFAAIDRTESTLGQHALFHRLRTAPVAAHLDAFEALVQRMTTDAAARERAQLALARLQDLHGYDVWWLGRAGAVERRPWYILFPFLTAIAIALACLAPFWHTAVMPLVAVLALNIAVRYLTDFHIDAVGRSFRQCAPLIATAQSLRFLGGDDIDPIVGPLRTDVPALARLKLISRWVYGDPFMLAGETEPSILWWSGLVVTAVYEYVNLAFLLDGTGVYFAVSDLSRHGASLLRATAAAGDVDAAISVASFRAGRSDWTRPDFRNAEATSEFTELRHPLVRDAVPNSIALRPGQGVLVTGSNMSGKSTFLRTVGVNAVLAQTINTCLAGAYRAPVFRVRSSIGRTDDLLAGKSYYIVEVEALLELVRASDDPAPHLFLLDELFRGTNAVERVAAGRAVLQELIASGSGATKPHVVLAATHDGELVDLAEGFDAYHFGDSIGPDGLTFDHRLLHGRATSRNAIALLRLHGAPESLLTRAETTAEMLDRQRGTTLVPR
ncbi:MAG: MutS-related protein [Vicinamibacterales bacterium]